MQQHIRNTCRAAAFGISKIGKIQTFRNDRQSTKRLIHTFVTTHLTVYSGLPHSTLAPLQHVQFIAARLFTKSRKHILTTPSLNFLLHWLHHC